MRNGEAMTRRSCLGMLSGAGLVGAAHAEPILARLPAGTPEGVAAILAWTLQSEPGSLNTDWFGTMLVKGLLEWSQRGVPEARDFAARWFEFHLKSGRLAPYSGARSRTVRAGGIYITTYAGHFGVAFPCYELWRQTGDERARRVCIETARIILHQTKRNDLGLVMHDDEAEFTIPDVCYFVVTPLMMAAELDAEQGAALREQAVYQLRTSIDAFFNRDTGLAKTILNKTGPGKSYWTRATGWLLWALTGVLRYLPETHASRVGFIDDLARLATGIARVQDASGGLRVFLNEAGSPLETTGTAMCAMGLHESIRRRWISDSYRNNVARAWAYVRDHITGDGQIRGAYTGWAVPAEEGQVIMDTTEMGWIPGFILSTAYELSMSLPGQEEQ